MAASTATTATTPTVSAAFAASDVTNQASVELDLDENQARTLHLLLEDSLVRWFHQIASAERAAVSRTLMRAAERSPGLRADTLQDVATAISR